MMSSPVRVVTLVGLLALAASGCTTVALAPSPDAAGVAHWHAVLESAEAGGALEPQLEAISRAAETGAMPLEAVNQLVDETFACFSDAGIPFEIASPDVIATGIQLRTYTFSGVPGLSDDQSLALADACIDGYSVFAESGFRSQPSTQQVVDTELLDSVPGAIACLQENGVDIDSDATIDDVRVASRQFITAALQSDAELVFCWPEHRPD